MTITTTGQQAWITSLTTWDVVGPWSWTGNANAAYTVYAPTQPSNLTLSVFRLLLSLLILSTLAVAHSKASYAFQCASSARPSLPTEFISADIVFSGIARKTGLSDIPFTISELYKSGVDVSNNSTAIISDMAGGFIEGQKYTIFAYRKGDRFVTSPCGLRLPDVTSLISTITTTKHTPAALEGRGPFSLAFIGRVVRAEHWKSDTQSPFNPLHSKLTFSVNSVLLNTSHSAVSDQQLIVYMSSCGEAYHVGDDYLVFSMQDRGPNPELVPSGTTITSPEKPYDWVAGCDVYPLNERDVLLKLSRSSKPINNTGE